MKIAYILGRLPTASETFIAEEIRQHLIAGIEVQIFPLLPPEGEVPAFVIDSGLLAKVTWLGIDGKPSMRILSSAVTAVRALSEGNLRHVTEGLNLVRYGAMAKRLLVFNLIRAWQGLPNEHDLIHCHFGEIGLCASALKSLSLTRAKLVTTFHGKDVSQIFSEEGPHVYDHLFLHGDAFLAVSRFWADKLSEMGADPERIFVHRLGVDCTRLAFRSRRRSERAPVRFISVGRMVEKKGHEITLRAVAQVRRERPDIDFQFDIVGDGPLLHPMRSLAGAMGIGNIVTLHGAMEHEDTLRQMDRAHVFVLASHTARDGDMEGIPVSIMEAQAMGLPVLSTTHSGISELVEDERTGFLSAERDVDGLARNIVRIAEQNGRWETIGRAGRQKVLDEFDQKRQAARLRSIYRTVLANGVPERP